MNVELNIPAIKKQLAVQQMTAITLAERSGISRQNISTMLRRGTCSAINAGRLASALGVDVETIWKEA